MLQTKLGPFNGKTWEDLCQLVFKKKYDHFGYQQIVASPGDFGLEGFTLHSGMGFQCYCPDKHYGSTELYNKQRDKITTDVAKLKTYAIQIGERIGDTKIRDWYFVTPEVDRNALLAHARTKEDEVRSWNLPILDPEFTIHLRDAEFYLTEINEIRSLNGESLSFDTSTPALTNLDGPPEEYEANIRRKTDIRLAPRTGHLQIEKLFSLLYGQTQAAFLEHGALLRRIEQTAPSIYFKLLRLVNEYENTVLELGYTWTGSADELVIKVRTGLSERIASQLGPHIDNTEADRIARHIIARWLAVCELDFV
jgi:hypothetical protein